MKKEVFITFIESMLEKYNMEWKDFTLEPDEFDKKLLDGELKLQDKSLMLKIRRNKKLRS